MFTELVEMEFSNRQNEGLESSFKTFYKLDSSPKIRRKLILEKDEYRRYVKSRTRQRTQFESRVDEIDLSFDSFRVPFEFIATTTEFRLPKSTLLLHEELDKPNGATKDCQISEATPDGPVINKFDSYFKAEQFILERFLGEINGNTC